MLSNAENVCRNGVWQLSFKYKIILFVKSGFRRQADVQHGSEIRSGLSPRPEDVFVTTSQRLLAHFQGMSRSDLF